MSGSRLTEMGGEQKEQKEASEISAATTDGPSCAVFSTATSWYRRARWNQQHLVGAGVGQRHQRRRKTGLGRGRR